MFEDIGFNTHGPYSHLDQDLLEIRKIVFKIIY